MGKRFAKLRCINASSTVRVSIKTFGTYIFKKVVVVVVVAQSYCNSVFKEKTERI